MAGSGWVWQRTGQDRRTEQAGNHCDAGTASKEVFNLEWPYQMDAPVPGIQ